MALTPEELKARSEKVAALAAKISMGAATDIDRAGLTADELANAQAIVDGLAAPRRPDELAKEERERKLAEAEIKPEA